MTQTIVYLIVHELFGVLFKHSHRQIELVTPVVPPNDATGESGHGRKHEYRIARFKEGKWIEEIQMEHGARYELRGVTHRKAVSTDVPCHQEFSPHPLGTFKLKGDEQPYCKWFLPLPKAIHQLRLISIRDHDRPIFAGDPHGDAVDARLKAISLVQAFEYELESPDKFGVYLEGEKVQLDYNPDTKSAPPLKTINLHIWAQLEDESGMDEAGANEHASMATDELVKLFDGIVMKGNKSLSISDCHSEQLRMPAGIRYPELMTLSEKFVLNSRKEEAVECTGKTCGHGGNLFVAE
jgi:hypothetical protein